MPFHPFLDGAVVASRPVDALTTSDVDLLIGTTRDEMRMFLDPRSAELDLDRLTRRTARYLPSLGGSAEAAPEVVARYDDDPHLPTPGDVWSAIQTDGEMRRPAAAVADAHSGGPRATFAYRFDEPLAGTLAHLGACHASDLPYPFGTVDRWAEVLGPGAPALADAVQAAWVAFAAGGDPSCPQVGSWPAYATDQRTTMLLSAEASGSVDDPDGGRRQAWADLAPVRSDARP
jgi:para-nitrobenzyl esterase